MAEDDANIHIVRQRSILDAAAVISILLGFGLIMITIWLCGPPGTLFNPLSVLIVIGSAFVVIAACISLSEIGRSFRAVEKADIHSLHEPSQATTQVLQIAELARKKGVLAIQNLLASISSEPFQHESLQMVVCGTPSEEVESIMRRNLQATTRCHAKRTSAFCEMGEFSTTIGLISTLIGLVQMPGTPSTPRQPSGQAWRWPQ